MKRLVIDTDPGVDDAQAIMIASAYPGATIEAVTTVSGNVPVELTTINTCKIMEFLDEPAPIYAGCKYALLEQVPNAAYVHGLDGLGDCGIPAPARNPEAEHAVNALVRLGNQHPGELTLVALGPLTNIALATRLDPDLPQKYKQLVVMGGAYKAMGNTPITTTEFNFYQDPEAAAVIFDTWQEIMLVSWELAMDNPLDFERIEKLAGGESPKCAFYRKITARTLEFVKERWGQEILFAADPLAIAVAVEPGIVTEMATHYVQVERFGRASRGQTVVDWNGVTKRPPNTNIVVKVDFDRFYELMLAAVA